MFFTVCATAVVGLHITGVGFLVGGKLMPWLEIRLRKM
jgi:hypothetical protein